MPFNKLLDSLQRMFTIFEEENEPLTERAKVAELLTKVQNTALAAAVAQLRYQLNTKGISLTVAANHLNSEISQTWSDYQLARKISTYGTGGRGTGRGGRSSGHGGQFTGRGRGGSGGRGTNEKTSNTGNYSAAEWEKLSYEERDKIRKERDKKGEQGGTKGNISELTTKQLTTSTISSIQRRFWLTTQRRKTTQHQRRTLTKLVMLLPEKRAWSAARPVNDCRLPRGWLHMDLPIDKQRQTYRQTSHPTHLTTLSPQRGMNLILMQTHALLALTLFHCITQVTYAMSYLTTLTLMILNVMYRLWREQRRTRNKQQVRHLSWLLMKAEGLAKSPQTCWLTPISCSTRESPSTITLFIPKNRWRLYMTTLFCICIPKGQLYFLKRQPRLHRNSMTPPISYSPSTPNGIRTQRSWPRCSLRRRKIYSVPLNLLA